MTSQHSLEITSGERFEFGDNWRLFLQSVDETRIAAAEQSLRDMYEVTTFEGRSFLDIGSGSGLFSLAARRLGARVHSFDYDPSSAACTRALKDRYFSNDPLWTVAEASVLDRGYMDALGSFDFVYSWGVLHHTGAMWKALDHARIPVASRGKLFIAIYNDCGTQSGRWELIKRTYNRLPRLIRPAYALLVSAPNEFKTLVRSVVSGRTYEYIRSWRRGLTRGMSRWRDIVDWVGGYPYEYAAPEQIFDFYRNHGFELVKLKCGGVGLGCNEFVFSKR